MEFQLLVSKITHRAIVWNGNHQTVIHLQCVCSCLYTLEQDASCGGLYCPAPRFNNQVFQVGHGMDRGKGPLSSFSHPESHKRGPFQCCNHPDPMRICRWYHRHFLIHTLCSLALLFQANPRWWVASGRELSGDLDSSTALLHWEFNSQGATGGEGRCFPKSISKFLHKWLCTRWTDSFKW